MPENDLHNLDLGDHMESRDLIKKVGRAIARQRKESRMTQAQVARELGIETETVSRLETGTISPTLERLSQFSDLYGCSVESFFQQDVEDAEKIMAKNLSGMLASLKEDERKLLLSFMAEAVKLFKNRK
ncbi:XRE family transcriptional regulator [Deltaproteobacteria bacterium Smac51]|nr:XRE family transcriptional regulator [Deltaproteobacteria bacterium Smac51]